MDNYQIQYLRSKYTALLPVFLWLIIITAYIVVIFSNNKFTEFFSNNVLIATVFIFVCLFVSLFLIVHYGMKILSKNINAVIANDFVDINNGERIIYYNTIKQIIFNPLRNARTNITTGYLLCIQYNEKDKIQMIVYDGTSKKEKENCKLLNEFYNSLNNKWNNGVRPHCT